MPVLKFQHKGEVMEVEAVAADCPYCEHIFPWEPCSLCEGTGLVLHPVPADKNFDKYMLSEINKVEPSSLSESEQLSLSECF